MAVLETINLKKYYGSVRALDNVSVSIEKGELLAVIGPSGSGKTTLLRSIAGFVALDDGKIYINSTDITGKPPERRNVAMFFQNYALWPHMNVYDNIAYGLKIRKMDKKTIESKVKTTTEILDIKELLNRKPSQLSGGQQQRVALARAIIVEPKVLLLDEPLSNLDAKIRLKIRFELKALQQRLNIPTLYVTHDQEEALSIADRIVIMHGGEVLQSGKPEEIYKNPKNLFIADFIGSNSIIHIPINNGFAKIGNITYNILQNKDMASIVIRSDEVEISKEKPKDIKEKDLYLVGKIKAKLYIGLKYRYEISLENIKESLFVNHSTDLLTDTKVYINIPKGSYFIF